MVRYEVRLSIEPGLNDQVERYMRGKHIPEILATGCFQQIRFDRLDPATVRTTYLAATRADLDRYLDQFAASFRADFQAHIPSGATPSREIWQEVECWPA